MSHGGGGEGGSAADPNLTPLLDVVLQLLMFFMMCVNFTQEQATADVKLPSAESARPVDPSESDVLYVNMKPYYERDWADRSPEFIDQLRRTFKNEGDTMVMVVGKDPMSPIYAKVWLDQFYKDQKSAARALDPGNPDPSVKTVIVLRASEALTCDQVYQMLDMAKVIGFRELRLRAKIQQNKPGGGT